MGFTLTCRFRSAMSVLRPFTFLKGGCYGKNNYSACVVDVDSVGNSAGSKRNRQERWGVQMKYLYDYEVIVTAKYKVRVKAENDEQAVELAGENFESEGTLVKHETEVGNVSSCTTIEPVRNVG